MGRSLKDLLSSPAQRGYGHVSRCVDHRSNNIAAFRAVDRPGFCGIYRQANAPCLKRCNSGEKVEWRS